MLPLADLRDLLKTTAFGEKSHRLLGGAKLLFLFFYWGGPSAGGKFFERGEDLAAVELGFALADTGNPEQLREAERTASAEIVERGVVEDYIGGDALAL